MPYYECSDPYFAETIHKAFHSHPTPKKATKSDIPQITSCMTFFKLVGENGEHKNNPWVLAAAAEDEALLEMLKQPKSSRCIIL